MTNPKPTIEEQITALHVLREFALTIHAVANPTDGELEVMEAIDTLDNADLFAALDEEIGCEEHVWVTALDGENESLGYTHCGKCGQRRDTRISTQSAMNGKIYRSEGSVLPPPASTQTACVCGGSFDGRRGGIGCTEQPLDPEEWGDTTREDMAAHNEQHADTYTVHPAPEGES